MAESFEQQMRASALAPLNLAYDGPPLTTLLGLRRYSEAIEWTKLHSKRFPNDPDGYFTRARIESYLDAVRLWAAVPPEDPLARSERIGVLYLAAGDAGHAEQSFRRGEEFAHLLRMPFGASVDFYEDPVPVRLLLKGDPRYD